MKKVCILIAVSCLLAKAYSQQTFGPDLGTEIPKIIPPSPNAAALEKFGTIPVDYSTGVPNISYPMWSWARGKLSFNLGLSYHAGGHKVEDMPSNVGLGWTLTGIGRVSRTVRGLRDDNVVSGFMYTPVLPQIVTDLYDGGYQFTEPFISLQQNYGTQLAITPLNSPYSPTVIQIVNSELDAEQDIFSFSFNGNSGRFVIDKNQTIIPLENTNLKIETICNPTNLNSDAAGMIIAFKITDDNGIVYEFEYPQQQWAETVSNSQAITAPPSQNVISEWLLTKIIDPTVNESIVFNYTNTTTGSVKYETGWNQTQVFDLERVDYQTGSILPSFQIGSDVSSYSVIERQGDPNITSINFPDGSITNFEYNFSRDDYANSKALTKVIVKNYQDEIIKQFGLNYSYFYSTNSTTPIYLYESDNDYNKRLRLDGVDEISSDGNSLKPTTFLYNSTRLNVRSSTNYDYWGYNVNSSRNNPWRVPAIEMDIEEWIINPVYGIYLDGADRRPDPEYVKAALLEKIQYPTGGFTSFEYECNRVLSEKNYYEDKLQTGTLEWYQAAFGQSQSINFPSRVKTGIEFLFKTEEFAPRPVPDPNEPQPCFENLQDQQLVRFEIKSTDNTFTTYVEAPYSNFLNAGLKRVITLPLDKSYTVQFIYDDEADCAFVYPFKASAYGTYYVPPYEKLAGGVRIKKIVSNNGLGSTVVKEYDYNNDDGFSSAVLNTIPNFGYYRTTVDATLDYTYIYKTRHINRTSNPTYTLNFHNGAPLIYTHVKEKELDGSLIERFYDPFHFIGGGYTGRYPYVPGQDFPNLSGLLIKQVILDKDGIIKSEEFIEYEKNLVHLSANETRNLKTGTIASALIYSAKYHVVDNYQLYTSRSEETSRITNIHENGKRLTQTQTKSYHPTKYYITEVETTNSKEEARASHFYYPFDFSEPEMTAMVQQNILKPVVYQETYKPNIINGDLFRKKTNYQLWNTNNIPLPLNEQRSLLGNPIETELTYNAYDDKGNLQQFTARDGVVTSFVWGYHQQYPVAKIIGKSYSDAISQSGLNMAIIDNPSDDAALRTELNKLRNLSGCLVTTYTYKPLVGITSETSPNGKTNYYEYDTFNRLQLIKDQDGNVVKKLDYHYISQ